MKNFFRRNSTLVSILIFSGIFIVCFFVFYGQYDLFRFPFDSNAWGNAGDWTMVIVTGITAVYLIKTFDEQKEANRLSNRKYKLSIRPYFKLKLEIEKEQNITAVKVETIHQYLNLTSINNTARNLDFINVNEKFFYDYLFFQKGKKIPEGDSLIIKIKEQEKHAILLSSIIVLTIKYSDEENNFYSQDVTFNIGNNWKITNPEPIKTT